MNWIARVLTLTVALALVVCSANQAADDEKEETKAAQKAIVELAKDADSGNVDAKKAAEIKKKYEDLLTVMNIYKPRDKGGLGVGPAGKGDGIELKLIALGKKAPSKMSLEKEQKDLMMMARVNLAMSEITKHYAPTKPKGGKGAKEWNEYNSEMKKATMQFIEAVKKTDGPSVKKAAENINNACNSCHTDFRD